MNLETLIADLERGAHPEYLCFWGHRARADGAITKSCFSQWFVAPFEHEGRRYLTAEHFMMAGKAELFGDLDTRDQILQAEDPGKVKALGRKVKDFDEARWLAQRWDIVVQANRLKFGQNPALRAFLLGTQAKVLVEASPLDTIWGIGLAADDEAAGDPRRWNGLNLLGFALMEVRRQLGEARVPQRSGKA